MAVYLYNLGFSASNAATGNFSSSGSGVNASNAWFQYVANGLPPGAGSNLTIVTSVLPATNWTPLTQVPSTFNAGSDYLLVRIFNSDNNPGNYQVRATAIFGQGDSASVTPNGSQQSPFRMVNGNALPVIDMDNSTFIVPNPPTWPAACTDTSSSTQASWTYCLGMVHNPTANASTVYIFNVGASVYDTNALKYYAFGIDPRMRVGGMGVPVVADRDKDAA